MAGAQSGRASAVGLAIESSFRSAPLTSLGANVYSVGIAATNPNRFFIVEPGGGYDSEGTKDVGTDEQDGDFEIHRVTLTGKNYPGKDTFKLDPENLYYPALGIFGRDVESTVTSGVYDHVLTHNKLCMPSFTNEEQFGDGSSGRLSTGVVMDALRITHGGILMAEIDYHAHRQIPNRYPGPGGTDVDYDFTSSAALLPSQLGGDHTKQTKLTLVPSYVDVAEGNCGNGPLVWGGRKSGTAAGFAGANVTLNDVVYNAQILPGWNVDISRDIESHMVGDSGYDPAAPVANVFNASGKMDIIFSDNTLAAAALSNCKIGIDMLFQGAQIGSTGYYYEYEVYLPRLKFLKAPVVRSSKTMTISGTFQAEKDTALGYSCKMRLRNAFTHAALAGTYPQNNSGGLGGFQVS